MAKHRAFKKHKEWAYHATLAGLPPCFKWSGEPIRIRYTITPKTANRIDPDNASAAMKAYQDGVAAALAIDDQHFALPEIAFAEPEKPGRVEVEFVT